MRVYVAQFGSFWSLTAKEWIDLCKSALASGGYDLTPYKMLKSRPQGVYRERGTSDYYVASPDIIVVEPLDWYDEDFQSWLTDNEELVKKYG